MSDPIDRLAVIDPERGRDVPPTPPFGPPSSVPSPWRGPILAVAVAAAIVVGIGLPVWLLGGFPGGDVAPADTTIVPTTTAPPLETTTTAPPASSTTVPDAVARERNAAADAAEEREGRVDGEWEGEAFDLWVPTPAEGAILGVVGVSFDDTLNVRSGPGVSFGVETELDPTTDAIGGTGRGWQVPEGDVWWEIQRDGVVLGWANQRYLARLGSTTDLTSTVVDYLGGIPEADSLEELAGMVAGARGGGSIVVVAPTEGDLGEVTVDLVGFADDSIKGERLHVFAARDGDGWVLRSVEQTVFCQRGLDTDLGVCV